MKILFDFDGTLVDSKERLYRLFLHLVPVATFSFAEYWDLKRTGMGHKKLLEQFFSYSDQQVVAFEHQWLDKIELPFWLALDKPFDGVTNHLKNLKRTNTLYLITARQHEETTLNQIGSFGWTELFDKILITKQKVDKNVLISSQIETCSSDWIVGDTGVDIQAGRKLGIQTAAVLSGFLSKESLQRYEPDLIIDNVLEFKVRL